MVEAPQASPRCDGSKWKADRAEAASSSGRLLSNAATAATVGSVIDRLRGLPPTTWVRAVPYSLVAALVIAIPSDLIDNPIFGRPIQPKPIDHVILAFTAALIGLIFAIRPATLTSHNEADRAPTIWGGFVSFLAVGCPVCNQAVVALVGTSGALSWWAPVQPLVGLLAISLLVHALRRCLQTYEPAACPLPVG